MKGEDLIKAIDILSEEKSIPKDDLFEYLEAALNAAYKRNYGATNSKVIINKDTGDVKVISYKIIVDEINMEDEEDAQVLLEEVKDKNLKVGDVIEEEVPTWKRALLSDDAFENDEYISGQLRNILRRKLRK